MKSHTVSQLIFPAIYFHVLWTYSQRFIFVDFARTKNSMSILLGIFAAVYFRKFHFFSKIMKLDRSRNKVGLIFSIRFESYPAEISKDRFS